MKSRAKKTALSSGRVAALVRKLATAIARRNRGEKSLCLVGIKRRGVPLAHRLAPTLEKLLKVRVPVGAIDITLYRDDLQMVAETPIVRGTEIDFDINGKVVLLVDDVAFTGRTVRAALTELLDFGRPKCIQLAVLVDRGHRELPIEPTFAGKVLKTERDDLVDICLIETDGKDGIYVAKRGARSKRAKRGCR
jgi:pyrimidine operon attenuation protein / uracil phosphoribosyltransferase